jgi:hypothetical protein
MGTEKQGKPIVELIKERLKMVAKGSCQECLYCEALPVVRIVGGEFITERSLEEEHYPTCHITLDFHSDIPRCFAFMPRNGVEALEPTEHHFYIEGLIRAAADHEKELGMEVLEVRIAPLTTQSIQKTIEDIKKLRDGLPACHPDRVELERWLVVIQRIAKEDKTMTPENKVKGLKEILAERTEMVAKGSCKTCKFRVPMHIPAGGGIPEITSECTIQGNWNPIWFSEQSLEDRAYPWRCREGEWSDDEHGKGYYDCFAYQPKVGDLVLSEAEEIEQTRKHREFMSLLDEAAEINADIEYVLSGEAQKKLAEALPLLAQYALGQLVKG